MSYRLLQLVWYSWDNLPSDNWRCQFIDKTITLQIIDGLDIISGSCNSDEDLIEIEIYLLQCEDIYSQWKLFYIWNFLDLGFVYKCNSKIRF